jgi:hypothetical protein
MLRRTMAVNTDDDPASPAPAPANPATDEAVSAAPQVFRSKVYRAKELHGWVVEPPRDMMSVADKRVFTGPRAQQLALTYAYETFGNARFFPY